MSVQPIPPPLEHLGQRPFSFYPPILNTDHNEWVFRSPIQEPLPSPAPVVGIRLESGAESRIGRLVIAVLVIGVLACFLLVNFFRSGRDGSRITYAPVVQTSLGLTGRDDYFAVVRKLGNPASDHWKSETGEMQYRILSYPGQGISVILMGAERDK